MKADLDSWVDLRAVLDSKTANHPEERDPSSSRSPDKVVARQLEPELVQLVRRVLADVKRVDPATTDEPKTVSSVRPLLRGVR